MKTQESYRKALDSFEGWLDGRTLNQDNAEDLLQGYVNWYFLDAPNHRTKKKGHSPNSVWNFHSHLKKYFRHLGIHVDEIDLPAKHEKELYPLKLSDMHTIFSVMKYDYQTGLGCQAAAGLRIGEKEQLKKKHFQWLDGHLIIKIPHGISKFKRARTVVLSVEMSGRVNKILKRIDDDDLVFGSTENVRSSEANKEEILRRALKETGLDMKYDDTGMYQINTHSFRAWFITRVSRHDPNLAKKLSGEKGYLLQYDRLSDEELVGEYKKFEADLTIFNLAKRDQMQNQTVSELKSDVEILKKENKELKEAFFALSKNKVSFSDN